MMILLSWLLTASVLLDSADQAWTHALTERITVYLSTREQAVVEVGGLTTSRQATDVVGESRDLAARIAMLRQAAEEGDILGPPVAGGLRTALVERLSRPDGERLLALVDDVQPARFTLQVNGRYPGDEPLATTPAFLIDALPPLPSALAYRFVRHDLVLLDRNTRLIVDVLRHALPDQAGR